ncbi:hypothetical protein M405DRAFT_833096 [Rhizopogon salebrosus TDB-379]|nr:hypothetical protein M405DRAFT_833096 [Rhizopogon salebrosus TDB-379]
MSTDTLAEETRAAGEGVAMPEGSEDENVKLLDARKQIEFYFADSNLPFDKFMWTLHTANEEHWVPIKTVSSFKRMREYTAKGHDWIVKALRTSEELEVDEAGENARRRTEVQPPKGQFERSIYAKGFGEEIPDIQKKLEAFFSQYGQTNAVRMRRVDGNKQFKGSVFVEFEDMKTVEAFLAADPKPSWDGTELQIMSKGAYCDMKIKEKGLTGKTADMRKESISSRKGFNAFKEMEDAKNGKGQKGKDHAKREIWLEFMGSKIRVQEEDGGSVKTEDVPYVKGATLKFTGCGGDANFTEMKNPLRERFARVPYIQFSKGDDFGLIGFDKALTEDEIEYVKTNLKTVNSKEVQWSIPEEEEEKQFQIDRANFAARSALARSQDRTGSSRGGRGGGRGGRGRGGRGGSRGGRGGRGGGRNGEKDKSGKAPEEQSGEKRKRAVEPDGGPDTGVRGQAVPTIAPSKKAKTDATS